MNSRDWHRLKPIVLAALDLSEQDQPAFVTEICGDDQELCTHVLALLGAPCGGSLSGTPLISHFHASNPAEDSRSSQAKPS